ncbi:MAG: polysaccharide deacetylase family protein [Lachnospiraceae bacterium]|nr:polysaccharide deacetylase family protein [Lachnospiraceae bacterium]
MKKLPFISALICAAVFLCGCGFLCLQYWNLDKHYRTLETEALHLQENNSELNEKLEENTTQLEDKENYIEGQKDYISELSDQIQDLEKGEDSDSDSSDSSAYSKSNSKNDPYPNLYADKDNLPVQSGQKYVYLTFDDGPSSLTPKVLDLLDEYDAHATFFVVQKNNEKYAEYLSEIVERGHTLALHSYSHDYNQIYRSVDAFLTDYEKVYDWVYEETGYSPSLFRFPGGSTNGSSYVVSNIIEEMERRGFIYYDWNVSSGDGSNLTTTQNIIDNVCTTVGNVDTPVVLMHDGSGKDATLAALPAVLKNLSEAGYEFRSLDKTLEPVQYR